MLKQLRAACTPLNVLLTYIALVFAMGGGARDDIASLVVLRPLSVGVLFYALVIARGEAMKVNRVLLGLAGAWTALVALHLVPLPPAIWHNLPGRELAVAIDEAAGLTGQWRPISLVPFRTLNSLLSLTVPLAGLVLAVQLPRDQLRISAYALLAIGMVSAFVSLLQVSGGGAGNPFYFYRITNGDSAVGLFANRNHNAILLALSIVILGALTALHRPKRDWQVYWRIVPVGMALALIPFLIITQSRAGLVLGVLALGAFAWLHRPQTAHYGRAIAKPALSPRMIASAAAAAALAGATYLFTAANGLDRLMTSGGGDDELRLAIWPVTLDLIAQHFPVGSGIGTFVEVYEAGEPASTLGASYVNHAHNDFLEVLMTGGLPAAVIAAGGAIYLLIAGIRALRAGGGADAALRRLGFVTLAILAAGSLYDYPLRTPSLALHFILALVWIAGREAAVTQSDQPAFRSSSARKTAGGSYAEAAC